MLRSLAHPGGPVTNFAAELRLQCAACRHPFMFLGLEPGLDNQGARVSLDGLEATLAVAPAGSHPSPIERARYNLRFNKVTGEPT